MIFKPVKEGEFIPVLGNNTNKNVNINVIPLQHYNLVNEVVVLFDGSPFLYIHGANPFYERSLKSHIESTLLNLRSHRYIGVIDGRGNFRKTVATAKVYKGNRNKTNIQEMFPYMEDVRTTLIEDYKFFNINGIEADDLLGILAKRLNKIPTAWLLKPLEGIEEGSTEEVQYKKQKVSFTSFTCVIASIDKDLLQLYSYHYDLKKHSLIRSTPENSFIKLNKSRNKIIGTGYKFLYAQILMGDAVDNIPGLLKCGPVKAFSILENCDTEEECESTTIAAFYDKEVEIAMKNRKEVLTTQEIEILTESANNKYTENKHLIFILRRHRDIGTISINTYPIPLFDPINSY